MKEPGKKVVGYGWSGCYRGNGEHQLGWLTTDFVSHKYGAPLNGNQRKALRLVRTTTFARSDMFRVKITIEPMKDKRGKYIVRRAKGKS